MQDVDAGAGLSRLRSSAISTLRTSTLLSSISEPTPANGSDPEGIYEKYIFLARDAIVPKPTPNEFRTLASTLISPFAGDDDREAAAQRIMQCACVYRDTDVPQCIADSGCLAAMCAAPSTAPLPLLAMACATAAMCKASPACAGIMSAHNMHNYFTEVLERDGLPNFVYCHASAALSGVLTERVTLLSSEPPRIFNAIRRRMLPTISEDPSHADTLFYALYALVDASSDLEISRAATALAWAHLPDPALPGPVRPLVRALRVIIACAADPNIADELAATPAAVDLAASALTVRDGVFAVEGVELLERLLAAPSSDPWAADAVAALLDLRHSALSKARCDLDGTVAWCLYRVRRGAGVAAVGAAWRELAGRVVDEHVSRNAMYYYTNTLLRILSEMSMREMVEVAQEPDFAQALCAVMTAKGQSSDAINAGHEVIQLATTSLRHTYGVTASNAFREVVAQALQQGGHTWFDETMPSDEITDMLTY